jgi:hypothetical protein
MGKDRQSGDFKKRGGSLTKRDLKTCHRNYNFNFNKKIAQEH